MLQLKEKQYNIAIATIEEHALSYSFLAFTDFKLKQSRFFKTGHTVPALVEMCAHQYKQSMPHSFQAMHTIKTFRQYKATTGRIGNKSKEKEKKKRKKKINKVPRLHGSTYRKQWDFSLLLREIAD